jgi:hypothetical protein
VFAFAARVVILGEEERSAIRFNASLLSRLLLHRLEVLEPALRQLEELGTKQPRHGQVP